MHLQVQLGAIGKSREETRALRAAADKIRIRMKELRAVRERNTKRKVLVIPNRLLAEQYKVQGVDYTPGNTVQLPSQDLTPIPTPRAIIA